MKLAVITPVGPGHETQVERAIKSVHVARRVGFSEVQHIVIEDHEGKLGRSKARNIGMVDADWYFFLDADDAMRPDTLELCDFQAPATFGAISLVSSRKVRVKNIYPCGWREVALYGSAGTLSMGFFCRADIARSLRFNETLDAGEDFDFYMRLSGFTKRERPLVDIGYDIPSAGGPRGYEKIDWIGTCDQMIAAAVGKDSKKYDLGSDAVLEKARSPLAQSCAVSKFLFESKH